MSWDKFGLNIDENAVLIRENDNCYMKDQDIYVNKHVGYVENSIEIVGARLRSFFNKIKKRFKKKEKE